MRNLTKRYFRLFYSITEKLFSNWLVKNYGTIPLYISLFGVKSGFWKPLHVFILAKAFKFENYKIFKNQTLKNICHHLNSGNIINRDEVSLEIVKFLENKKDLESLKLLHNRLNSLGMYSEALKVRNNYITAFSLDNDLTKLNSQPSHIAEFLCRNGILLKNDPTGMADCNLDIGFLTNGGIVFNDFELFQTRARIFTTKPEYDFTLKLISGKNIAIVGPSSNLLFHGVEIDGYDLVVRLGHRQLENDDIGIHGSKTDICFLSGGKDYEIDLTSSKVQHFWLPKKNNFLLPEKSKKIGLIQGYNNDWFTGNPFNAMRALVDILSYSPANVKLFNLDFYTTHDLNAHNDERNPLDKRSLPWLVWNWHTSFSHDLLSNFHFAQVMHRNGWFTGDKVLESLFKLSDEEIVSIWENIFEVRSSSKKLLNRL